MNSEWRLAISDWCMIFLEGSAPALPKNFSAHWKTRPPVTESWAHLEVCPPKRRINSALKKICQIPCPLSRAPCPSLAKASGMRRKNLNTALSTTHSAPFLCTLALVHAYTPARMMDFSWRMFSGLASKRRPSLLFRPLSVRLTGWVEANQALDLQTLPACR